MTKPGRSRSRRLARTLERALLGGVMTLAVVVAERRLLRSVRGAARDAG